MSEEVQKLVAVIEARSASAEKQMERFVKSSEKRMATVEAASRKSAARVDAAWSGAFNRMGSAAKSALASVAAMFTFSGISSFAGRVKEAANRFDELGDTADRLGTSAGGLVKFQQALNASGGDVKAFNGAAEEFQGKIGALIGGIGKTKATKDALSAIGITREQINNAATLEQRLLLIADGLTKVGDSAVRAAIADKLGIRPLLPLLEKGRDGVLALTNQFTDMAAAADEGVKRTKDMADKIVALEAALQMKEDSLFVQLAPAIMTAYSALLMFLDLVRKNQNLISLVTGNGATIASTFGSDILNDDRIKLGRLEKQYADLRSKQAATQNGEQWTALDQQAKAMEGELRRLYLKTQTKGMMGGSGAFRTVPSVKPGPLAPDAGEAADAAKALADAAKEAERAAKETERLSKAAKSVGIDLFKEGADKALDEVRRVAQASEELAQRRAAFKDSFKSDFVESFKYAVQSGDIGGAFMHLAETFGDRILEKLGEQAFDALWNAGFGGIATDLFGDADLAQAAFATSTTTATTAVEALASAAWGAANALGSSGSGGSGDGWGAVLKALGMGGGSGSAIGKSATGVYLPGRAAGGPVSAGMPYVVGEKRAELFVPNVSGHIIPRIPQATPAAANSNGGGPTYQVTIDARGATKDAIPGIVAAVSRLEQHAAGERGRVVGYVNDASTRRQVRR